MNFEKTEHYYRTLNEDSLCHCVYCRNYYKEIRKTYPELTAYLTGLGVDIEKPFEAMPIEPSDGIIIYTGAQYIVMGNDSDFHETNIGTAHIRITDSHPMTDIEEEHFVIEAEPIFLKWTIMNE